MTVAPSSALAADNTGQYLSGDAIPPDPENPNGSTYEIIDEPVSTDLISVTLVIEAGNAINTSNGRFIPGTAFRKEITTNIGGGSVPNTVTSLLDAVDGTNDLTFYGRSSLSLAPFTASTDYLAAVAISGDYSATWVAGSVSYYYAFNGWEFRVNDKFPVQETEDLEGWEGTNILQTPIVSGDVVHFFYEFPSDLYAASGGSGNIAAKYIRAEYSNFDSANKKLTVQLQGHEVYIEPTGNYIMSVNNYVNLQEPNILASLYDLDGNIIQACQSSNTNGTVTFTNVFDLAPGETYIVKTVPSYYYNTTNATWANRVNGAFLSRTGAYNKVTIPTPAPEQ
jgi:hypothetical protein